MGKGGRRRLGPAPFPSAPSPPDRLFDLSLLDERYAARLDLKSVPTPGTI